MNAVCRPKHILVCTDPSTLVKRKRLSYCYNVEQTTCCRDCEVLKAGKCSYVCPDKDKIFDRMKPLGDEVVLYQYDKRPGSHPYATLQIYEEDFSQPLPPDEPINLHGDVWVLDIKVYRSKDDEKVSLRYIVPVGEPEEDDYLQKLKDWATQICELMYHPPEPTWEVGD